jgi:hypothetical protein
VGGKVYASQDCVTNFVTVVEYAVDAGKIKSLVTVSHMVTVFT